MSSFTPINPNTTVSSPVDGNSAGQTGQNPGQRKNGNPAQQAPPPARNDTVTLSSEALKLASRLRNQLKDSKVTTSPEPSTQADDAEIPQ